jgi:hypothetical protein
MQLPISTRIQTLAQQKGYFARRAAPAGLWLLASRYGGSACDRNGKGIFTTFDAIEYLKVLPDDPLPC